MTYKRELKKDTYYHIYNRGNTKRKIFFNETDYTRFGNTITRYLQDFPNIRIHVWSFLPNHFHLLVSESTNSTTTRNTQSSYSKDAEEISKFMQKIQQAYARYLAVKYGENLAKSCKSPLFEGRFKAKVITDDDYLAQVAFYIRNNALKHGLVDDTKDWAWAGATEYPGFPSLDYGELDPNFDPGFE